MDFGDDMGNIVSTFSEQEIRQIVSMLLDKLGGALWGATKAVAHSPIDAARLVLKGEQLAGAGLAKAVTAVRNMQARGAAGELEFSKVGTQLSRERAQEMLADMIDGFGLGVDSGVVAHHVDAFLQQLCDLMNAAGCPTEYLAQLSADGKFHGISIHMTGASDAEISEAFNRAKEALASAVSPRAIDVEDRCALALDSVCRSSNLPGPTRDADGTRLVCSGLLADEAARACETAAAQTLGSPSTSIGLASRDAHALKDRLGDDAVLVEDRGSDIPQATLVVKNAALTNADELLREMHANETRRRRRVEVPMEWDRSGVSRDPIDR